MMRMVVKMAAFSTLAVLLLCCSSVTSTDPQSNCDLYAETNKDFTVPLHIRLPENERLQWTHNNVVIFRRRQGKVSPGAEGDVSQNGSLKLTKMSQEKAGNYIPEVFDGNGRLVGTKKIMKLCVIDPVPKPTLEIGCSSTPVKLTCKVPQGAKDLNFAWRQNGVVMKNTNGQTLKLPKDSETATFICSVSNKVSSLDSAPVPSDCPKPGFVFPKEIFGISTWYFVGGGGGVVLLLIILVIVCCIRMRRKKTMRVKDEEELRLGWTNPNQQHQQHQHHQHGPPSNQHHHHHHHQQQPAGHTGPRQHRSKQQRGQPRPRDPAHPNGQPQPSPRRAAQVPRPVDMADDDQPPPLPQPRKKAPKPAKV